MDINAFCKLSNLAKGSHIKIAFGKICQRLTLDVDHGDKQTSNHKCGQCYQYTKIVNSDTNIMLTAKLPVIFYDVEQVQD